jgi:hypothetical protein
MYEYNEEGRKVYDLRFNLLVNIQYCITFLQSALLNLHLETGEQKMFVDYLKLTELQTILTKYSVDTLRKIYHDLSLKVGEFLNEK